MLRADSTGVTGCSRYGKGAFVTGVFDQRIALTMPIESGTTGGAPAIRSIAGQSGAQPLSSAYGEQPWLGDAFGPFHRQPEHAAGGHARDGEPDLPVRHPGRQPLRRPA